ncbi:RNA polymerase sigma factor [Rhodovibrio salinarum]|nr:RNA polymerase sigma factor [Rhodovibrio salinarum]
MTDLDALYSDHANTLRQFAYRRTGDADMAADLVQEAFAKYAATVEQHADRPAVEQPQSFLRRTIVNLVIDGVRRRGRRGRTPPMDELAFEPRDHAPLQEQQTADRQHVVILRSALAALPARERDALIMNRVHGKTHAQIAAEMNVSPSMVSKYIMNALRKLKRQLPDATS